MLRRIRRSFDSSGEPILTEHPCPRGELLREFAVGKMGGPEWESVARHVETCADCQEHLNGLDPVNDNLVSQLKRQSVDRAINRDKTATIRLGLARQKP